MHIDRNVIYFPLKALLGFLVFTEILFFIGPLNYGIVNQYKLIFYLIILNFAFYRGYKYGVKKTKFNIARRNRSVILIKTVLIVGLLAFIPKVLDVWGLSSFSIGSIINRVTEGINSPNDVYLLKKQYESNYLTYINMLLSPFYFMAVPIGVYNWRKLNKSFRFIVIGLIFLEIILWLGIGTRKGIIDILLITIFILASSRTDIIGSIKEHKKYLVIFLSIISVFIFYFIYSNVSRYGVEKASDLIDHANYDHIKSFYLENFSPTWNIVLSSVSGYLSHGYYALACALESPFTFSYGFGNSWFTLVLSEKLGVDAFQHTYLAHLEDFYGIDSRVKWHTIYTWLASDFTFFGVPIIIFHIGKYLAISWIDTITDRTIFAAPMLALFVLMVFYFYANNQIISFSFIEFFSIFFLWKVYR